MDERSARFRLTIYDAADLEVAQRRSRAAEHSE
jgi:hypothetical protein